MRPLLPGASALAPYLERIDSARIYSNWGPLTEELSVRLGLRLGVQPGQVAVLSTGTAALQAAIETVGHAGDTWSVPSWTFVATAHAVDQSRRRPHFVDIDEATWSVPVAEDGRFHGAVVVAPFGDRPDVGQWAAHSTPTLFDAASCFDACQGIGADLGPRSALMLSLHATKTLPAGAGGVLIGPDDWMLEVRKWANFGIDEARSVAGPGTNAKMSEYHAAIALASLDQWEHTRKGWAEVNAAAVEISERFGLRAQPALRRGFVTTTWVVELGDADAKLRLKRSCDAAGVDHRDWWGAGVAENPYFRQHPRDRLSSSHDLAARTLGLPMSLQMTEHDLERVAAAIGSSDVAPIASA
jgi:dTDP-4-amino-4,6-dideoxygalactose transaminase